MNKFMRLASITALMATTGFIATGCECTDQGTNSEGQNVTECESTKKFVGTSITETVPYTSGQALNFDGVNGNVDVRIGGTDVVVEFMPFSVRGHSKEAEAKKDIENDVMTTLDADGAINVKVRRASGAFNGVGADVVITLPSSFDGAVNIVPNNGYVDVRLNEATPTSISIDNDGAGDIDVTGARGALNIKGSFDISVDVSVWGDATQNGSIVSDGQLGDIIVSLPTASAGSIQATSEDSVVTGPSPLPEFWIEDAAGDDSKTFNFGIADAAEPGAVVQVSAAKGVTIDAT